jgi:hypothetical protein
MGELGVGLMFFPPYTLVSFQLDCKILGLC